MTQTQAVAAGIESADSEYQALLEVSESIAQHRDLNALFHDLAGRLHPIVEFDFLSLVLHDDTRDVMRLHILETDLKTDLQAGKETPVDRSLGGEVWKTQQPLLIADVESETRLPEMMEMLRQHQVQSVCTLPLTTAQRRLGAMGVGSREPHAYGAADVEFLTRVARQVAVAVDNALNAQAAQSYQAELARERDRLRLLLDVNDAIVSKVSKRELFAAISAGLRRLLNIDYTSLAVYDTKTNRLRVYALDFPENQNIAREDAEIPLEDSPPGRAFITRKPVVLDASNLDQFNSDGFRRIVAQGLRAGCILPLVSRDRVLGTLNVGTRRETSFTADDVDLLTQVANQIATAVENALAFSEIEDLKEQLAQEKLYLEDEIRTEHNFEEIVGDSPVLKRVLRQIETVAPTDAAVLIEGETGTGKEVFARAIHNLSRRRDRTFVKINCAAIPAGLLESELFGHEKGAFTGAITQRAGRFELAHRGTLFLDEVGDIPLELQPKLLRALQEQEFERLGSTRTLHVDVRVIAATNRNLAQMVAEGRFRGDLYYRLNVFPLEAPPLRERRDDIPQLVRYFVQKYALRMERTIETVPAEAQRALADYSWPGNIRELENFIERAVILSRGPVLNVSIADLQPPPEALANLAPTLEAAERDHILRVLGETNWMVGGPKGAAARLGLKRTTLQSKMKKLGISRS
ncbi:MAG TPA: sigma 54-interacting transcriptional regulator [Terriglobia bacterium]|nr:sigma 54-interacting transcriptional regulator [Terriglobia bacterium]